MKIAVVGTTGLVGIKMLEILEERSFPVTELIPVATKRSIGRNLKFKGAYYKVVGVDTAIDLKPDIALFSAGSGPSKEWAPRFAEIGTTVIDNSSAWRMEENIKLIVPEINAGLLTKNDKIIANPNCSTIQMVLPLAPLHKEYQIKRIIVSTYQSVTGTGAKAVRQLENERAGEEGEKAYPWTIDMNCLPHCDIFLENGYTKEEMKMVNETQKILEDYSIRVTATTVRVPVMGGHSESVNIEFEKDFDIENVRRLLSETPGIIVEDDVENNVYPMPVNAEGKDHTFVGRIRRDESHDKALNMWIVADNLRKGAATNAIQIAEHLANNDLI